MPLFLWTESPAHTEATDDAWYVRAVYAAAVERRHADGGSGVQEQASRGVLRDPRLGRVGTSDVPVMRKRLFKWLRSFLFSPIAPSRPDWRSGGGGAWIASRRLPGSTG